MLHEPVRTIAILGLATMSGWLGWSGVALLLPIALAFPVLWSIASNRRLAALVAACYFLAASRGLPQGIAAFYQTDLWPGVLFWLAASLSFVAVHAALWTRSEARKPIHYFLIIGLMAVPPFGIIGWAHPITAAGIIFPGWGWWGLAAMTAGLMGLVSPIRPTVASVLVGFWLWSAATWADLKVPDGWYGIDLDLGASLGREAGLARQLNLIATARGPSGGVKQTIVLPESAIGNWTPTVERLWVAALKDTSLTVITGASVVTAEGYDNVLGTFSREGGRILYRERMPVPGSMWQPWRPWLGMEGGVRADFFANPIIDLNDQKIAPLICYEQLIVWPTLQSMLHGPDMIIAVGNGWWTADTSIVAIQRASTSAWAHLFGKPLIVSFNI